MWFTEDMGVFLLIKYISQNYLKVLKKQLLVISSAQKIVIQAISSGLYLCHGASPAPTITILLLGGNPYDLNNL